MTSPIKYDDAMDAEAEMRSADPAPTSRLKRWMKILAVLILCVLLAPLVVGVSCLAYRRATALKTPETIEELFPAETLLYAKLKNGAELASNLRGTAYFRDWAWLDDEGKNRDLPEALEGEDAEALEDVHDTIKDVRQALYLSEKFLHGDVAAALLPSDDSSVDVWVLAARLENAAAAALGEAIRGLLWFTKDVQKREHQGVAITAYIDKEDPEKSIQLAQLGEIMVLIFGTPKPDVMNQLAERYGGIDPEATLRHRIETVMASFIITEAPSETAKRNWLEFYANGQRVIPYAKARAERYIERRKPKDAMLWIDVLEVLGPYQEILADIGATGEHGVEISALGRPSVGAFERIRGGKPVAAKSADAVLEVEAVDSLETPLNKWAASWILGLWTLRGGDSRELMSKVEQDNRSDEEITEQDGAWALSDKDRQIQAARNRLSALVGDDGEARESPSFDSAQKSKIVLTEKAFAYFRTDEYREKALANADDSQSYRRTRRYLTLPTEIGSIEAEVGHSSEVDVSFFRLLLLPVSQSSSVGSSAQSAIPATP